MTKHLLFMLYALVAYLIFLATFLYAVGFVGGFLVPTELDLPSQNSLAASVGIDVALLALFAIQHSVMARKWFKERWTQIIPWTIERATYVLCASLALILLFWQWRPIGIDVWRIDDSHARLAIWMLCAAGWGTVLAMTFYINHFDLFGLRQAWLPLAGRPYVPVSFLTPFPYRVVRHPLYVGFLIAFWATPHMTLAHLLFAASTTAYVLIAIQFEEADLIREHGSSYQSYRRRVPMLLPRLFRRPATQNGAQ
jgi:protein-S-isoprenylcysteine O-methyltransferase Ste14